MVDAIGREAIMSIVHAYATAVIVIRVSDRHQSGYDSHQLGDKEAVLPLCRVAKAAARRCTQ